MEKSPCQCQGGDARLVGIRCAQVNLGSIYKLPETNVINPTFLEELLEYVLLRHGSLRLNRQI
jgi:hypothetical protein